MTAMACGGLAGCGSSNSTSPQGDDGGDAGEAGFDAQEEMSPTQEGGTDAPKDSPTQDVVTNDSPTDSPADSPADSPKDSPSDGPSDGGGAVASFSTNPINLGAGNCGGAAVTGTLSIKNTGSSNLTVNASIAGSTFTVSPATLTVTPGNTGSLTVSATVPQTSTAGTALSGSLSLTTNDPAHASATISLAVTPTGATLAWGSSSPTAANFGTQTVNKAAAPIGLTLSNTGNAAATVAYAAPGGTFSLSPLGGSVAAAGTLGLQAGFTPTATQSYTASSALTVTGAVCGTIPANVKTLAFSGAGGSGNVTGWPTGSFDFGPANCGGSAPSTTDTFTLTNSGAVAVNITGVTFSGAAGFTTSAAVGQTIPGNGGTLNVTINAPAVPFPTSNLSPISSTLTITTDAAPGDSHSITTTEEPTGAILALSGQPAGFGTFGTVPVGQSGTQNFNLVNSGNADTSVTVTTTDSTGNGQFDTSTTSPFTVTGNGGTQGDGLVYKPVNNQAATGTMTVTATNLCEPAPAAVNLYGTGQNGGISTLPAALNYSEQCAGAAAANQNVAFTNTGNLDFNWTASLKTGTMFSINSAGNTTASGTSLANGGNTSTLVIIPNTVAKDSGITPYTDTLVINTTIAPNNPTYQVPITLTPLGDALVIAPATLPSFPDTEESSSSSLAPFTVSNTANAGSGNAVVSLSLAGGQASAFAISGTYPASIAPAANISVVATFNAPNLPVGVYTQAYAATINMGVPVNESNHECLPPNVSALNLAANDIAPGPKVNVSDLWFGTDGTNSNPTPKSNCGSGCGTHANYSGTGYVGCGTQAGDLYINVSNLSPTQSFNITQIAFATGTNFTQVTTLPAAVAPGGAVELQLHPVGIPATSGVTTDFYADSITISTDSPTVPTLGPVSLHMGAFGAIITNKLLSANWNFGTVPYGGSNTISFGVTNTGNEGVTLQLSGLSQGVFGLQSGGGGTSPGSNQAVQNQITLPGGTETPFSFEGTFTPNAPNGNFVDQGTLSLAAGGGAKYFCGALDASWSSTINLSGQSGSSAITFAPSSLQFPTAMCSGSEPAAQSVTFTNAGNTVTYTATLNSTGTATGTDFAITAGASGTINGAGGTAAIQIAPTALLYGSGVVPGALGDTLQVQINGGSLYNVPISMNLEGAVLAWSPFDVFWFSTQTTGSSWYNQDTASFYRYPGAGTGDLFDLFPSLSNSGNQAASGGFNFTPAHWTAAPFSIPPNGTNGVMFTYTGATSCGCNGTSPVCIAPVQGWEAWRSDIQEGGEMEFQPNPNNLCQPITPMFGYTSGQAPVEGCHSVN